MSKQTDLMSFLLPKPVSQKTKHEENSVKEEPENASPSVSDAECSDGSDASGAGDNCPFLCEICETSRDGRLSSVFKTREHLFSHTIKRHPLTCLCCFETFDNSADLSEHVEANGHKVSVCGRCESVFPDEAAMQSHECEALTETLVKPEEGMSSGKGTLILKREVMSDESDESSNEEDEDEEEDDEEENSEDDELGGTNEAKLACLYCCCDRFIRKSDLVNHTGIDHPSVCCICFEGFDDEESLCRHQQSMRHFWWKCTPCKLVLIRKSLYSRHVFLQHQEQCRLKCQLCDFRANNKSTMDRHEKDNHKERKDVKNELVENNWNIPRTVCCICKIRFMSGYSLTLHMYRQHNVPDLTHIFKCELCNLGFGKMRIFELHLKEHHSDDDEYLKEARSHLESIFPPENKCEVCNVSYGRRFELLRHQILKHPSIRPHKCDVCEQRFLEESDVLVHKHTDHNGPTMITCPICHVEFLIRWDAMQNLSKHLWSVHGVNMMPDSYCFTHNMRFYNGQVLRKHLTAVHKMYAHCPKPQQRWYTCDMCGKEIKVKRRTTHNQLVHPADGPVKCIECNATFKTKEGLNSHMKKHTDQFQCKICGKGFEMRPLLERHKVVHSGEKPFQCELCGLRVSQKSSLQRHIKVVHKGGTVVKTGRRPSVRRTRGPAGSKGKGSVSEVENGGESVSEPKSSVKPKTERGRGTRVSKKRGRPRQKKRKVSSEEETSVSEYESSEETKWSAKRRQVSTRKAKEAKDDMTQQESASHSQANAFC